MRATAEIFWEEKGPSLTAHFSDNGRNDKFSLLNELNLSLQGRMTTVFKLADKVAAFKVKLEL